MVFKEYITGIVIVLSFFLGGGKKAKIPISKKRAHFTPNEVNYFLTGNINYRGISTPPLETRAAKPTVFLFNKEIANIKMYYIFCVPIKRFEGPLLHD